MRRTRSWRGSRQDLALYQVQHDGGRLRYKCLRHGTGLRPIDGGDLTGRYLDEFFPEPLRHQRAHRL